MTASEPRENNGVSVGYESINLASITQADQLGTGMASVLSNASGPKPNQQDLPYRQAYASLAYDVAKAVQGYLQKKKSFEQAME